MDEIFIKTLVHEAKRKLVQHSMDLLGINSQKYFSSNIKASVKTGIIFISAFDFVFKNIEQFALIIMISKEARQIDELEIALSILCLISHKCILK